MQLKRALALCFLTGFSAHAADSSALPAPAKPKAGSPPSSASRLLCKTGPEKRAPGQPLKLFFQYNLPFQFEPEDPTIPFGRQTFYLAGRPVMQLYFDKSPVAAGERGENLSPMSCAFAKRPLNRGEPSQVQILIPVGEKAWISQTIGQKPGYGPERVTLAPGSDLAFTYQYEKVFSVDLDDAKDFVTAQKPRPLALP
ncbi:MAG: hypothetical protein EOP11_04005 [Proteobacteria bacterium]|nr:MAG: hypothetical protein EOP11_04005 [Pseudomonadota bacterium]